MKIVNYLQPNSSFLSVEKDLDIIISSMLKDDRLKKLLYYTSPDALSKPPLTEKESIALLSKNIKLVPKLKVDKDVLNYIIVGMDYFSDNETNPEFRDNKIFFDIVCHFDQWQLEDIKLRPYQIASEIDTLFNNQKLTGLGEIKFVAGQQIVLSDEFAGLSLMYEVVHGGEDKFHALDPDDDKDLIENFNNIFNS